MPEGGLFKDLRFWGIVLAIVGGILIALPMITMPQEIVHQDVLNESNDHSSDARLELDSGDYEVWMTRTFWSFFNLDQPAVYVNSTEGARVPVSEVYDDKERKFDGNDCQQFAKFHISEKGTYDVAVDANFLTSTIPWGNSMYVAKERAPAYAILQWTGVIVLVLGLVILGSIAAKGVIKGIDKGLKDSRQQQPYPPAYPPQYPPQQPPPPGYPQHPPQQYPPQPPPPGYAPPPGSQGYRPPPPP
jgi:hypothetical protein